MRTARTLRGVLLAGAIAALAVTPAIAQEPPSNTQGQSQVSCDPANPDPGAETTCTAEGLKPDSFFDWTATFADDSQQTGSGTADAEGVGEFTVTAPEGEQAEGDYTVTVTGTAEDDSQYEESHEGTVGGGSGVLGILPSGDSSEEPSEEPTEDPSEDPSEDDTAPAPGGNSGQVNPAPSGAVATGAGGASGSGGGSAPLLLIAVLAAAALAGGIWWGQRANPETDDRG